MEKGTENLRSAAFEGGLGTSTSEGIVTCIFLTMWMLKLTLKTLHYLRQTVILCRARDLGSIRCDYIPEKGGLFPSPQQLGTGE